MGLIVLSVVGILVIGFCMFVASRPTAPSHKRESEAAHHPT